MDEKEEQAIEILLDDMKLYIGDNDRRTEEIRHGNLWVIEKKFNAPHLDQYTRKKIEQLIHVIYDYRKELRLCKENNHE